MRFTHPFLGFCGGNKWAALILPAFAPQNGEAFPFINEFLDFACPIAESAIANPNDRQERDFARRMVPHPILRHIQPFSYFLGRQETISLKLASNRCWPWRSFGLNAHQNARLVVGWNWLKFF
jgi:hypothetical protein